MPPARGRKGVGPPTCYFAVNLAARIRQYIREGGDRDTRGKMRGVWRGSGEGRGKKEGVRGKGRETGAEKGGGQSSKGKRE